MATATITKTLAYANGTSGLSYNVTTTKTIEVSFAYQADHDLSTTEKDIFVLNDNPAFSNFKFLHIENTGATDCNFRINAGSGNSFHTLEAGTTFEIHSNNFWNDDSGANPDTMDGLYAKTAAGTTTIKLIAYV